MNKKRLLHPGRLSGRKWSTSIVVGAVLLLSTTGALAQALPRSEKTEPGSSEGLSLKQAVGLAVQNSRELALARAQHDVAEKAAAFLRAQFRPNLYTGSGIAYTKGFPPTPSGVAPPIFNVQFIQTVFNGPARGEVHAAERIAEVRRLGAEAARDAVVLRTASAYLELALTRHSLDLLRRERVSAEKILEVTRERVEAGIELPLEATRAKLSAARVEQRIAQLETREEALAGELRNLLGLPPGRRLEVGTENLPQSEERPVRELVELALASDLVLKQAESERRAREQRLQGQRLGRWPTVDVVSQYGVLAKFNTRDQLGDRPFRRHNFLVGLDVKIPIFSSRTSASVSLAQSELRAAEIASKNKREVLDADVRRQARRVRELEAAREVAHLELQVAQENLRVFQAQFQEGRLSLRDLEKGRLEESDKWMAFLDADYQRQKAQLELLRATGQLARVFQ